MTNFKTVKASISRLKEMEAVVLEGGLEEVVALRLPDLRESAERHTSIHDALVGAVVEAGQPRRVWWAKDEEEAVERLGALGPVDELRVRRSWER